MDINLLTAAETESLRSLILSSDNIILCCHRSPDGDALGSLLGMAEFLRQQGKVPVAVVPQFAAFLRELGEKGCAVYAAVLQNISTLIQHWYVLPG